MLERCALHKKYFGFVLYPGTKPPLEDESITDTICPQCLAIVEFEDTVSRMEQETIKIGEVKKDLMADEAPNIECTGVFSPYAPNDVSNCDFCPCYDNCEEEEIDGSR